MLILSPYYWAIFHLSHWIENIVVVPTLHILDFIVLDHFNP